jgi:hypothetical protein
MTDNYGEGTQAQAYLIEAQAAGLIGDDWQASNDGAFYAVDFGDGQGVVEYTADEIVAKLDPKAEFFNREQCGFRWREAPQSGEQTTDGQFVWRTCTLVKGHLKPIDHHDEPAESQTAT